MAKGRYPAGRVEQGVGVAACDVDGDGAEELYILNTDQYSGSTSTSDRLVARDGDAHVDLFSLAENRAAPTSSPAARARASTAMAMASTA